MHPVICSIGPFTIYSYGLMVALAFLAGVTMAQFLAKKRGLNTDFIYNLCFLGLLTGIIGARILYVIEHFDLFRAHFLEIIMLQHGGLSWFGGLSVGFISALVYIKHKKQALGPILDCLAPALALAHAIGRIGCFLNGCCFGKESSYGILFPGHAKPLIPTQLYSAGILLIVCGILLYLQSKPHRPGRIFCIYVLLYSAKRFCIEFWRGDNYPFFMGLTLFQTMSLVFFIGAVIWFWRDMYAARIQNGR
ncbi:MAG TPA: prolipoprotein diacylglyceryl transferase [Candidatus Omnitrophota bacterium]|nr:prolipoprotein diacylglyceryl transferase [Candidatus Omnitrophota bacterium]HPT06868.1 prolipoprotein diacylglyceryl transferase [Candidatus Omnitrophota bacterium]